MKNYVQPGNTLTFTAAAAIASDEGLLMGTLFGVATASATTGQPVEATLVGVDDLPKITGAIAAGQKVYWDAVAKAVTTVVGTNKAIGAAIEAALSGAALTRVRLDGVA